MTREADIEAMARAIEETGSEAEAWARNNTGPGHQEIFMAQVAVSGTLKLLASKLRSILSDKGTASDVG